MALPARVNKLEDLPEPDRQHFKESDDGQYFVADITPTEGMKLANVDSLENALEQSRADVRYHKQKAASLREDRSRLEAELEDARKNDGKGKDADPVIVQDLQRQLDVANSKLEKMTATAREANEKSYAQDAVRKGGGKDKLERFVRDAMRPVLDEDGDHTGAYTFHDENGAPYVDPATGKAFTSGIDLVKHWKKDTSEWGDFFPAGGKPGGGTPTHTGDPAEDDIYAITDPVERIARARETSQAG